MASLTLKDVKKVYPHDGKMKKAKKGEAQKKTNLLVTEEGVVAVQEFNLEIADKEFIVLVGPSGCGKSTTLRMVAGLEEISGKEWHGWKLVEGRSNRKYTNEDAVVIAVSNAGFDPYERKVLGITAMQKLLGKSRFEELLSTYIEKPQGKPTLVPESDKRPEMNTAKNDFMEEF